MINKCFHGNGVNLLNSLPKAIKFSMNRTLTQMGNKMNDHVREEFLKPKSGRLYREVVSSRTNQIKFNHKASAIGESPANMFGDLSASIHYDVQGGRWMQWGVSEDVYGVKYGARLEECMNRPYLKPTVELYEHEFTDEFVRILDGRIKNAIR